MNCEEYRKKYLEFKKFPLAREIHESEKYEKWQEHGFDCESWELWDTEQQIINRGYNTSDFPCIHIAYNSTMPCDKHDDSWGCPDMTIVKIKERYGIPVRDGGTSYIKISHCPWCGVKL